MASIRRATNFDIQKIQNCNLWNLPENQQLKYYMYHTLSGPELIYVAEYDDRIVGYVMTKVDEEQEYDKVARKISDVLVGHITSLSVLREQRKMNIARKLMLQSLRQMKAVQRAKYCTLHVRVSNRAAQGLQKSLRFGVHLTDEKQQADLEDAQDMRQQFDQKDNKEVFESAHQVEGGEVDMEGLFQ